jgi:dihydroflavonol-4-reductase
MRIGITGAFGFLGSNIAREALARGYELVAFASRRRAHPFLPAGSVELRDLRLGPEPLPAAALAGLDAIVHAAGATSFRAADARAVWDVNVLGSRALYEAALDAGVARLVDLSSVNAVGSVGGRPADECGGMRYDRRYPCSFAGPDEAMAAVAASAGGDYRFLRCSAAPYIDSKVAALELSRRYARERGLPLVTVYPGTAVGAGDLGGGIGRFVDMVWEGRLGIAPSGSTSYMDAGDFARGALAALERGAIGEDYILAGETMSYAGFMALIRELAGNSGAGNSGTGHGGRGRGSERLGRRGSLGRGRAFVVPAAIGILGAGIAECALPGLGLYRALAVSGAVCQAYDSGKAMRELGYRPECPLAESIRECRRFSEALRSNINGA